MSSARGLVPALAARASETEVLRRLPLATVSDLTRSGLTRLLQPTSYGGAGAGAAAHIEVCAALARGCVSTAWCNFVWGVHNFLIGLYPAAVQQEVWGSDPATLVSASIGPVGKAEVVDGGVLISGRWGFNSGCDHAAFLLLGATSEEGAWLCLVPSTDYRLIDNWQVVGLRGTGSKDAEAEDLFVPSVRALTFEKSVDPNRALLTLVIAGPVLGAAEAAMECFRGMLKQSNNAVDRQRFARLGAEVRSARLILMDAAYEVDQSLLELSVLPQPVQLRIARDTAFAAGRLQQVVNELFAAVSGRALHESEPLQQLWRDITAGCSHARLRWDLPAEMWAVMALAEDEPPSG